MLPIVANAVSVDVNGICYNLNSDERTAEVTSNPDGYSGDIVIPDKVIYGIIEYHVTSIANSAFLSCYNLASVTIPNDIKTIGNGAFNNCTGLKKVRIGANVEKIERGVFQECSSLQSISIPEKVNEIGWWTFKLCTGLKDVYCNAESLPITDAEAFSEASIESATLHVPVASIEVYRQTAPWSGFGKIVALAPYEMRVEGDANGDGEVNAADIVFVVNIIKKGATEDEIPIADMNGDGVVNSIDIKLLSDIIMNI